MRYNPYAEEDKQALEAAERDMAADVQSIQVPSSKNAFERVYITYKVRYRMTSNGPVAFDCTCKGYEFRQRCRHLSEAEGMLEDA